MTTKKKESHWLKDHWREWMAAVYALIVMADFIFIPALIVIVAGITKQPIPAIHSLTLENGGIFHASMGAILGVASYTHGKEAIEKVKQQVSASTNG